MWIARDKNGIMFFTLSLCRASFADWLNYKVLKTENNE